MFDGYGCLCFDVRCSNDICGNFISDVRILFVQILTQMFIFYMQVVFFFFLQVDVSVGICT